MRTLLVLALLAGCHVNAARVPVTVPMIHGLGEQAGSLRGSVDQHIVARYVAVGDAPNERRIVVSPGVGGRIVGMDEDSTRPSVFVSFDPQCSKPACAFTFVPDPGGALHLSAAPHEPGFEAPVLYAHSVRERNRLRHGADPTILVTSKGAPVRFETTPRGDGRD